jgi:uncharacterized membrane protein YphA (DoxX/SURF4 family)
MKDALGPLVLRLGLATILLYHGGDKVTRAGTHMGANWQYTGPIPMLGGIKPPPPPPGEWLQQQFSRPGWSELNLSSDLPDYAQRTIAWGEVVSGAMLLFGFLTRLGALGAILFVVIEALYTPRFNFDFHRGFPLLDEGFAYTGGAESTFALYILCAAVFLIGGGTWSLDRLIFRRRRAEPAAVTDGRAAAAYPPTRK